MEATWLIFRINFFKKASTGESESEKSYNQKPVKKLDLNLNKTC